MSELVSRFETTCWRRAESPEIGAAMGWNVKRVYNELFKARRSLTEWQARSAKDEER